MHSSNVAEEDDRLITKVERFLSDTKAWLDFSARVGASPHQTLTGSGRRGSGPSIHDDTNNEQLQHATGLLKEALREWKDEKKQHARTKELLRLALLEIREAKSSNTASSLYTSPSAQPKVCSSSALDSHLPLNNHAASSPVVAATPNNRHHLEELMFQASPSFIMQSQPLHSPPRQQRHRPLSPSSTTKSRRAATPPFSSHVPRFQDAIPAGNHMVVGLRSDRAVGLEYKTNADVQRLMALSPKLASAPSPWSPAAAPPTSATLRARTAIEQLQARLSRGTQQQQPPSQRYDTASSTLYSPSHEH